MPYDSNKDLPARVREGMPDHAQSIFRNTFNSVIEQDGATESSAFAQAYGAIENSGYKQDSAGNWSKVEKHLPGKHDQKTHGRKGGGGGKFTERDADNIEYYTSGAFKFINNGLREGSTSPGYDNAKMFADEIDKSINKLPPFEGTTYRVMDFSLGIPESNAKYQTFLDTHKIGDKVNYNSFTSTSKSDKIWGGSGTNLKIQQQRVIMNIKGKNGRDVSKYSANKAEQEVLFKTNSKFLIKNITRNGRNDIVVDMEET